MFSRFPQRLSQITEDALFVELSRFPKIDFDTAQFAEFVRWPKMFDNVPFFSEIIPPGGGGKELPMMAYTGRLSPKGVLFPGGCWGFHRGKPVPFGNRASSWIFEAHAPGYERASAKIEGGGRGREKTLHPRPPPLAHFVNSLPGPDLAARIQDGDLITNSCFFRPSNRLRVGMARYQCQNYVCLYVLNLYWH